MGFHNYIQERTADGSELTDFVLSVFRGENGASTKERMDAATWLADGSVRTQRRGRIASFLTC